MERGVKMEKQNKKEPRAVILSLNPRWCALVASGKKTAELRKTAPQQILTPFKVYIYATKKSERFLREGADQSGAGGKEWRVTQKVIGEFICDSIYFGSGYDIATNPEKAFLNTRLTMRQIKQYLKIPVGAEKEGDFNGKYSFAVWHISQLKIYDNPKPLSDFGLKCPPQSWCYIYDDIGKGG